MKKRSLPLPHLLSKAILGSLLLSSAALSSDKVLWNHWYTITLLPKTAFGYYNEKVLERDGKVFVQTDLWKKEKNFLNEEHFGVVSQNDEALTPFLYSIQQINQGTNSTIDGTVSGTTLKIKEKIKDIETQSVTRFFREGSIFSSHFPVWIKKNFKKLKPNSPLSFYGIIENNIQSESISSYGTVTLQAPDELSKKTGTSRLRVDFNNEKSTWWIKETGETIRIEMEGSRTLVQSSDEKKARAFVK